MRSGPIPPLLLTLTVLAWPGEGLAQVPSPTPGGLGEALPRAEARSWALAHNPELQALEAAVRAAEGALVQARPILNPQLQADAEDFGGDLPRWGQSQVTYSLAQPLEPLGKRQARTEAVRYQLEGARQAYRRKRLDVLFEADRAFTDLLGAQERAGITGENLETAREVAVAVEALVTAGEVSPIELARARSDESLAAIERRAAERDLAVARQVLTRILGGEEPGFEGAEGSLPETARMPTAATAEEALQSLPELAQRRAEVARQEALLRLARRSRWPDCTLSAGWRRYAASGEHGYVAGLALPLPLFNRNRGAVIEASARLDQGRLELRAGEVLVRTAFQEAVEWLVQAESEALALRDTVLPLARQAYDGMNEGYRRGKFRLLDLLEARRTLAATRLRYVDARVRLGAAQAEADRLLGGPADISGSER